MSSRFPGKTNDTILIQAMVDGDMGAFAEIYKRYAPGMRRFVAGMIKDRAKAEDIVQNIFMRLMTTRPAFDNAVAFKNWLFVCARNEVISTLRSKWESQVEKVEVFPERVSEGIQPEITRSLLNPILAKMPKKRSEVFRMSKLEGVSVDKQQLIKLNLSSDGTFEPEGLHIRKGQMYLGFVGDYPTAGSRKHTCVIKLK